MPKAAGYYLSCVGRYFGDFIYSALIYNTAQNCGMNELKRDLLHLSSISPPNKTLLNKKPNHGGAMDLLHKVQKL
jgi:hypothetical protein